VEEDGWVTGDLYTPGLTGRIGARGLGPEIAVQMILLLGLPTSQVALSGEVMPVTWDARKRCWWCIRQLCAGNRGIV